MRIALAHDSLTQFGGAERVLEALHELYPDAPVFTLVFDKKLQTHFEDWTIVSSPLQFLYNFIPRFQWMLPFIPFSLGFFDFSGFDLIISTSSAFIKNIKVPKGVKHICYCHTPARFAWVETDSYVREEAPVLLQPFVKLFLKFFRKWDFKGAQKVDFYIANSKNVQERIKKYYHRDSEVIYPCIDLDKFYPATPKSDYYVAAARLQAHKRTDLVIKAFNELGKQLHVIGVGRALEKLKSIAGPTISFLGRIEDQELCNELSGAKAFIFPQEEDFGLMPLEAMACGTPVVAYAKGGVLETVLPDKTGVLFEQQSVEAIKAAVLKVERAKFFNEDFFDQAQKFSKENFKKQIQDFVTANIK